jgi:hypothetical protein
MEDYRRQNHTWYTSQTLTHYRLTSVSHMGFLILVPMILLLRKYSNLCRTIRYVSAMIPILIEIEDPIKKIMVLLIRLPMIGSKPHRKVTTTITNENGSGVPKRYRARRKMPVKKVLTVEMST